MRKSGGGAQVVDDVKAAASTPRLQPPAGTPAGPVKQRPSDPLHELALRKRKAHRSSRRSVAPPAAPPPATEGACQSLPARAGSTSVRATLLAFRRHWNGHRQREVPCWLASLVLHLLAVVSLGSLTIPVSRNRTVMSLLLTFGEIDAPADNAPVELLATAQLTPVEEPLEVPATDLSADPAVAMHIADQTPPKVPPPRASSPGTPDVEAKSQAAGATPSAKPPGQSDLADGGDETLVSETTENAHDEIVEKFIEFDVGRLTGAEGAKARTDFDRLGAEAIRSLVRGLNKSASIHASCPVMVIASKIETLLRENPDPALLRYALENIGRGVPRNAPHSGRLRSLLAQLRPPRPGSPSPKLSNLLASLKARDRQSVLAGIRAVVAEGGQLADFERRGAAWGLIRLLTHRDAALRSAAHQALVALAGGTDCGPANDRRPGDRFAAAGRWSLHFDEERYQATAESVLKNAQHLADAGKRDAARKQFQKLAREYPGSTAAEKADEYLDGAKTFALK